MCMVKTARAVAEAVAPVLVYAEKADLMVVPIIADGEFVGYTMVHGGSTSLSAVPNPLIN